MVPCARPPAVSGKDRVEEENPLCVCVYMCVFKALYVTDILGLTWICSVIVTFGLTCFLVIITQNRAKTRVGMSYGTHLRAALATARSPLS